MTYSTLRGSFILRGTTSVVTLGQYHPLPDKLLSGRLDPFIFLDGILEFLKVRQALPKLGCDDGIFGKLFEKGIPFTAEAGQEPTLFQN